MPTPLDMPARRTANAPRLAYSTSTAAAQRDRAVLAAARERQAQAHAAERECPGCSGETSKAVGARLGCTFCVL